MIRTPAKINFGLSIGSKRDDGYHPLSTLFLRVGFYDLLLIEDLDEDNIRIICTDPDIPVDQSNICWKAAELFFEKTGIHRGLKITLQKNIPSGGGLGGGSSNAAAVLDWLFIRYPEKIEWIELMDLAVKTGADVPFFLMEGACFAEGIGEILTPVDIPFLKDRFVILVMPELNICTADAFAEFDRKSVLKDNIHFLDELEKVSGLKEAQNIFTNDFEDVIFPHYPQLREIKEMLISTGAEYASMTGSGSVIYGIYPSMLSADQALAGITNRYRAVRTEILT